MDIVDRMQQGKKVAIGMVHLLPLPGTLRYGGSFEAILVRAVEDARKLEQAGFDALIVENVNDGPFESPQMTTWQIAALAIACDHVRRAVKLPIGIDSCGNSLEGFMIGDLTGVSFIRIPYFVDTCIGQVGVISPNGSKAVMLRKRSGLDGIRIFADIQVKHTYPLSPDIPIETSAIWAKNSGADALIVTGMTTGMEPPMETLRRVKAVVDLPLVVGSGMNAKNAKEQFSVCDGSIVGSALKRNGSLMNPIDEELTKTFIAAVREAIA